MRRGGWLLVGSVLLVPASVQAGQLYGTLLGSGKGIPKASIEIDCAGNRTTGTTADDGSYRINVSQQGRCTLSLPLYQGYPSSHPSAYVFSYSEPAQYDFDLVQRPDGKYELRRR